MKKPSKEKVTILINLCVGAIFELLTAGMDMPTRLIVKTALNVLWHLLSPKGKASMVLTIIMVCIFAFSLKCR